MTGGQEALVPTPLGPGRLTTLGRGTAQGLIVLGHGAGGQSWSPDIVAAADAAVAAGWRAVLVDQPWRVAGHRVASPPASLDTAWVPLIEAAVAALGERVPLVVAGRSAGARVACRTALGLDARGVLAVSFPLHPPGRPAASRSAELGLVGTLPLRVVQGERDPFGSPAEVRAALDGLDPGPAAAQVVTAPGTHSFRAEGAARVGEATRSFLEELLTR